MKKIFFATIILIMVSASISTLKSGQMDYKKMWDEIESYEKKSQPESALKEVNDIYNNAKKEKNEGQILKCIIYKHRLLNEKYQQEKTPELIAEVEKLLTDNKLSEEANALLHLIVSKMYQQFYDFDLYDINIRTEITDYVPDDLNEWTKNIFTNKIKEHQQAALNISDKAKRTKTETFADAMILGEDSRELRPTLFDFIVYEIASNENNETYNEKSLLPTDEFLKQDFSDNFVLQQYQQLIKFHQNDKKELLYCELERLKYAYSNRIFDDEKQIEKLSNLHIARLEELYEKYKDIDFVCEVASAQAKYYQQKGAIETDSEEANNNKIVYYKKAYDICQKAIETFPKYKRINNLRNIANEITRPNLDASCKQKIYPNKDFEIKISHKNVKSAFIKVYKINKTAKEYATKRNLQGSDCISDRSTPVLEKEITFDDISMFAVADTAITLNLDCGIYEYVIADSENSAKTNTAEAIYVSKYEILKRNIGDRNEIFVLDRLSGDPQTNVKVETYEWNGKQFMKKAEAFSDSIGRVMLGTQDAYKSLYYALSNDNDKHYPLNYQYNNYYRINKSKQITSQEKTTIFTDRKIYRPGQKIYFKAIVYNISKNTSAIVSNKNCVITLHDANSKEISSINKNTNEYGSICGEFVLPKDVLPGNFTIKCNDGITDISVEEYKRPKFEITFDDIKSAYTIGDTVIVSGNIKTYSGIAASNAKISYIVKENRWWNTNDKLGKETKCDINGNFHIPVALGNRLIGNYIVEVTATDEKGETQSEEYIINIKEKSIQVKFALDTILQRGTIDDIKFSVTNANNTKIDATLSYKILHQDKCISRGTIENNILTKNIFEQLASGKYTLQIEAKDNKGDQETYEQNFHIFSENDKKITDGTINFFYNPTSHCKNGETAKIYFGSSEKITALYRIYDGEKLIESRWIKLNNELQSFDITYKSQYESRLTIQITFLKNEQLFTNQTYIYREIEFPKLKVELTTFRDKILPGSTEDWKLKITENGKPANCEFLCTMYDASLDAFRSNAWIFGSFPRIEHNFIINNWDRINNTNYSVSATFKNNYFTNQDFVFDSFIDLMRYYRYGYGGIYDSKQANFMMACYNLAERKEDMDFAETGNMDFAVPAVVTQSAESNEQNIKVRSNFAETAFFYPQLKTDKNGEIAIKFTIPETLTRWKFIGLAHTKDLNTNTITQEIVSQKPFSLSANTPRFVMFGDELTLTATISSMQEQKIVGKAYLEILDEKGNSLSKEKLDFTTEGIENKTLSWKTKIDRNNASLTFRFVAESDNFSDGEQYKIPVYPDGKAVFETMPFAVKKNGTSNFTFDVFNKKMANSDNRSFVLEYNNNPVWSAIQAIPYVTPQYKNTISNFVAFYANMLGNKILHSENFADYIDALAQDTTSTLQKNEDVKMLSLDQTNYWGEAQDETSQHKKMFEFFDEECLNKNIDSLFTEIKKLQQSNGAFVWFDGMNENRFVTQFVAEGLCRLQKQMPLTEEQQSMKNSAIAYLQKCFDEDYERIKHYNKNNYLYVTTSQIYYLYILCSEKNNLNRNSEKYIYNQIKQYWTYFSLYDKALTAIVLNNFGDKNIAKEIIKSLRENAEVKNFEMYWPKNVASFFWNEEPIVTQCTIIEAFETIDPKKDELEQMKIWLLNQKRAQKWDNEIATINAVSTILSGNNFSTKNNNFSIQLGDVTILPDSAKNLGYVKKSFESNAIQSNFGNISVTKTDDDYSYGCAYWQYFANYNDIENSKGGDLNINKKIFVERTDDKGKHLEEINDHKLLKVGDKATVRISVKSSRDMDFVCINDGFASCFEPAMKLSGYHYSNGVGYYQAYKDNAIQYFFDTLRKGTYVFEYTLYVSREGEFSNGVGEIQCIYAPAFYNHTQGGKINISK